MDNIKNTARELWWLMVLQGIVTLLLGMVVLFWPGLSLIVLLYAVAFYGVIVGAADLIFGFATIKKNRTWWFNVLSGIVLIGIAVYLIRNPDVALATFVILLGLVFVVRGIMEVVGAAMNGRMSDRVLAVVGGVLAVIAGIVVWMYPVSGSLAFVWVIGLFAIVRGAIDIAEASSAHQELEDFLGGKDKHDKK